MLVTPRWLAASVLALLIFLTCLALASWQWTRAHRPVRAVAVQNQSVVPLTDVVTQPGDDVFPTGLLVRGTGHYAGDGFVATGTNASGVSGTWAVSPFAVDAGTGSIAVVRGSNRPTPSAPVSGAAVITGRLQPPATTPRAGALTAAELRAKGTDPRGYLVLIAQQPVDARPAVLVTSPAPAAQRGLRWQNAVYTVQWLLFGFFALFAWGRFFRDDLRGPNTPQGYKVEA